MINIDIEMYRKLFVVFLYFDYDFIVSFISCIVYVA